MTTDRPVHFRIHLTHDQALRTCCIHRRTVTGCRPCQLEHDILAAPDDLTIDTDYDDEGDGRTFTGTAHTPAGRQLLARLIALAHEHPDPTTLEGWPRAS